MSVKAKLQGHKNEGTWILRRNRTETSAHWANKNSTITIAAAWPQTPCSLVKPEWPHHWLARVSNPECLVAWNWTTTCVNACIFADCAWFNIQRSHSRCSRAVGADMQKWTTFHFLQPRHFKPLRLADETHHFPNSGYAWGLQSGKLKVGGNFFGPASRTVKECMLAKLK